MYEDPESLKELNKIKVGEQEKSFVTNLQSDIETEKTSRAVWEQNVDRYINMRYGIREKKNFPWPNAANFVIPLIDADINRIKPSYINLINVSPMVSFVPYGAEDIEPARKREQLFDWRMRTKVDFFNPYVLGVDYMLTQGFVVFKISWKYSTRNYTKNIDLDDVPSEVLSALFDPIVTDDVLSQIIVETFLVDTSFEENVSEVERLVAEFRLGKSKFELTLVECKDDQPEVVACNVREDLVFPVGTTDLAEARFIDYMFTRSKNDLKISMNDGRYEKYTDEEIESWFGSETKNTNKNKARSPYGLNEMIWIHETCVWYDINNDGIEEKCIVTWPDQNPSQILRFIELPYEHGEWPYVLVRREINDSGIFTSRGIPAVDEDFQNGISTSLNQAVDNGTITNTPQIVYKRGSVQNIKNIRYIPGNAVETNGPTTDYEVRQSVNISQGILFQQAQYLKSWADQRLGNMTSGLSQTNNPAGGGSGGSKTKKEIDVIEGLQAEVQSMDLQVFQSQMAEVYYQIDALYEQFGAEEEEIITNEKPVKMSRQEIQGRFDVMPNGRLDNSNPTLRASRSFNLMRIFLGDPDIRQRELKKMFLDDFDVKLVSKLFKTEQELQQEAMMQQQAMNAAKGQAVDEQLSLQHISDLMEIQKEAALAPIQGKKYAAD